MKNKYKVPSAQWKKWSKTAKAVFNRTYTFLHENQELATHPKSPKVRTKFWQTTAWNASWIAADAVDNTIPDKFITVES